MTWKASPITWGNNPTPRRSHISFAIDDSLYIFGGLRTGADGFLETNELLYSLDYGMF